MPTFEPPLASRWSFAEGSRLDPSSRRFWSHFGLQPRGQTVIRTSSAWATVENPTQAQLSAADSIRDTTGDVVPAVFRGGHVYTVTSAIATELTNAGYTVS